MEYKAELIVTLEAANDAEVQHQLENLCNLMRQIEDIVKEVSVNDYSSEPFEK